VPLILGDQVETLCDANYVNNPALKTWNGGLEILVYPAGTSQFTLFDGTAIQSEQMAGSVSMTITSASPRPMLLRILAPRPAAVELDGTAVPEIDSTSAFDAASEGWQFDAALGFVLVKFQQAIGTTTITL